MGRGLVPWHLSYCHSYWFISVPRSTAAIRAIRLGRSSQQANCKFSEALHGMYNFDRWRTMWIQHDAAKPIASLLLFHFHFPFRWGRDTSILNASLHSAFYESNLSQFRWSKCCHAHHRRARTAPTYTYNPMTWLCSLRSSFAIFFSNPKFQMCPILCPTSPFELVVPICCNTLGNIAYLSLPFTSANSSMRESIGPACFTSYHEMSSGIRSFGYTMPWEQQPYRGMRYTPGGVGKHWYPASGEEEGD